VILTRCTDADVAACCLRSETSLAFEKGRAMYVESELETCSVARMSWLSRTTADEAEVENGWAPSGGNESGSMALWRVDNKV
jgi:hypothetical protein